MGQMSSRGQILELWLWDPFYLWTIYSGGQHLGSAVIHSSHSQSLVVGLIFPACIDHDEDPNSFRGQLLKLGVGSVFPGFYDESENQNFGDRIVLFAKNVIL